MCGNDVGLGAVPPRLALVLAKGGRRWLIPLYPEITGRLRVNAMPGGVGLFPFFYPRANRIVQRAIVVSGEQP